MKQKILVTGGAGFIGSNFIRYILNKYSTCEIINLDKLTYAGNLDNLRDVENNPNYQFTRGDICDILLVDRLTKGIDTIINMAAESHVDRSITDSENFVKTNTYGTWVLLECARKNDVSRFVQVSTDEVYGSIKEGKFTEESPLKPNSPYSASKAAADLLVKSYEKTHKLNAVITRSSNNFGPYQYPEKIIPLFITNLLENKKVPLYGAGLNVRDWIYVKDNCEAIDLVMHKGKKGEIYNVGSGNELTNKYLTELIIQKLNKTADSIEYVEDRKGHDWRYALDCTKIKKLGWQPKYSFDQAIDNTIKWYGKNKEWWKKLKS